MQTGLDPEAPVGADIRSLQHRRVRGGPFAEKVSDPVEPGRGPVLLSHRGAVRVRHFDQHEDPVGSDGARGA